MVIAVAVPVNHRNDMKSYSDTYVKTCRLATKSKR